MPTTPSRSSTRAKSGKDVPTTSTGRPKAPRPSRPITTRLDQLRAALTANRSIGFPAARDIDYSPILPFFNLLINNVGGPETDPETAHTKAYEREVLDWFADLFEAPEDDRWGYLTNGGTESNHYGLYLARSRYPDGVVYRSDASHYSVDKVAHMLALPQVVIRATETGELDYDDLRAELGRRRDRPAIVVANGGTTMTEAVDDPARIHAILDDLAVRNHHLHVDSALAGVPLALLPDRPVALDLSRFVDSIAISSHKFFGTPIPGGVVLTRRTVQQHIGQPIAYTATSDTTVSGSRCGQLALLLWYAIQLYGADGMRDRADRARELASYAQTALTRAGWPAYRNPHAFTVYFRTPPDQVRKRWTLANDASGTSHLICMPGVTREEIDEFASDLAAVVGPPEERDGLRLVPRPRSRSGTATGDRR